MINQYTNDKIQRTENVDTRLIASRSCEAENWKEYVVNKRCFLHGRTYLIAKRIIDVSIILMVAPIWLPIFLLCALLIKLDSPKDPVFFKQYRTGKNGRRFAMLKYRTMVTNAEELKASLAHQNLLQWPDFKVVNDPRITTDREIFAEKQSR